MVRFRYTAISEFDLADLRRLREFEVVFATCQKTKLTPGVIAAVRDYVAGGGILYASDLRFDLLAAVFPSVIDKSQLAPGAAPQEVQALSMLPLPNTEVAGSAPHPC